MKTTQLSITHKILIVFSILIALSTFSFLHLFKKAYQVNLLHQARNLVQEIIIFRKWAASFGGIWTKDKYTPGIGYLMSFDTPEGELKAYNSNIVLKKVGETHFYLHNPGLATRELSQLSNIQYGWSFRIVSDRYMAPQSKPDKWEAKAIKIIEKKGVNEYWGWDGKLFRYARAIYIRRSCLRCHGPEDQIPKEIIEAFKAKYGDNYKRAINYKVGDLRGIISLTILPKESVISTALSLIDIVNIGAFILAFLIFWLFTKYEIIRPIEKLTKAAHDISLGKLDTDLGVRGLKEEEVRDEITKLAIAIDRLRASIHIAIERLKKKK